MSELGATVTGTLRRVAGAAIVAGATVALLVAPASAQQTGTIAGSVTSATGQPLADVVITVVGTESTGLTTAEGRFLILNVPAGDYTITATYIGYGQGSQPVTVPGGGGSVTVDFQLQQRAVQLEGVVVTGTAIAAERREVGNSIDLITAEDIEASGVTSVEEILRGRIQGLSISGASAQPGVGSELNIRGLTSINGRSSPLIYVDGTRVGSEDGAFDSSASGQGAVTVLQSISPQDIERIEVIKGSAASTLYGTDATAGVIQIFTKRGGSGERAQWTFSSQTSLVQPSVPGPGEDIDPTGLHLYRCDINGPLPQDTFPPDPDCPESGSWLKDSWNQNLALQVRGGTEGFSYFASGGYNNEQGIVNAPDNHPGAFAESVFLRANFTFDPFESLQIQINNAYTNRDISFAPDGSTTNGLSYNVSRLREGETLDDQDAQVFDYTQLQRVDQFTISSTVNWTPMDNMRHRFNAGVDWSNSNGRREFKAGHFQVDEGDRVVDIENNRVITLDYAGSWLWELPGLNDFSFTTSWGGQLADQEASGLRADTENFINRGNTVLEQGADITNANEDRAGFINGGFFVQQQVGWNNQLFVTGGVRVDSYNTVNQRLEAEPLYQVFPKLQAAYTMSDHSWFPSDVVETFRLRAAWGKAGDPPPQTDARTLWDARLTGRGNSGFVVNQIGNIDVEPETTSEYELGADVSALNGRVNLSGQYFFRATDGGLIDNDPIPSLGIIEPVAVNVGEWETWGYEATLDVNILQLRDFRWNINTSYQWLENEMLNIGLDEDNSFNIDTGTGSSSYRVGFQFPGIFRDRILNGDEVGALPAYSDSAEFIGINFPPQELSISSSFGIGSRLQLDLFGYGQFGHVLLDNQALTLAEDNLWPACVPVNDVMDPWELAGSDESAIPTTKSDGTPLTALDIARCWGSGNPDTRDWYQPADFFRFASASLQYRLPEDWLPGAITGATVQLQALNLNLFTDFEGTDPDAIRGAGTQSRGRETGFLLPLPRTYSLNIRLNF